MFQSCEETETMSYKDANFFVSMRKFIALSREVFGLDALRLCEHIAAVRSHLFSPHIERGSFAPKAVCAHLHVFVQRLTCPASQVGRLALLYLCTF